MEASRVYNCAASALIEAFFFRHPKDTAPTPDEDCPICLENLRKDGSIGCCGTYAKQLLCGHFVHVSCQIDYNSNYSECSVCRKDLNKKYFFDLRGQKSIRFVRRACHESKTERIPFLFGKEN